MAYGGFFVLLFLGLALFYPLFRILALGVGEGFARALANPYYWERYLWSLEYGLLSALFTLSLALPLAFLFRRRFPLRGVFLALSTLPFVLPTPVVALGFLALLGPRGLLGVDLYGTKAILFLAAIFYNLGLALRILLPVALNLEGPLQAARVLGASSPRAFLRVGLPLLLPALGSAGLLVFIYAFSAFGVPLLLGGAPVRHPRGGGLHPFGLPPGLPRGQRPHAFGDPHPGPRRGPLPAPPALPPVPRRASSPSSLGLYPGPRRPFSPPFCPLVGAFSAPGPRGLGRRLGRGGLHSPFRGVGE